MSSGLSRAVPGSSRTEYCSAAPPSRSQPPHQPPEAARAPAAAPSARLSASPSLPSATPRWQLVSDTPGTCRRARPGLLTVQREARCGRQVLVGLDERPRDRELRALRLHACQRQRYISRVATKTLSGHPRYAYRWRRAARRAGRVRRRRGRAAPRPAASSAPPTRRPRRARLPRRCCPPRSPTATGRAASDASDDYNASSTDRPLTESGGSSVPRDDRRSCSGSA